ncbi:transposase family protein, partial [Enterococcus durans]|uniref:transposase family protein n=1 Tax=Enterococcus durans TaxID=53345 RepID=UPI001F04DF77
MSHTQLIKDTLNILDLNIHFEENCLTKEKYKGQICLIYKGTLLYKPEECPHCLCVVPSRIIRWGTTTVRLLLNDVLDLNIYFEENCLTKEKYKGQICLIYKGTLQYTPEECPHCLCVVPSRIIRWGTTTVRLLLNDVSEYRTYLELKKQRFKCKSCQRTFVADTSVAEKHCFISQKVRWSVIARLKENTSMTEIARQKNISTSSVYRV